MWDSVLMIAACALTFLFWKITQKEHNIYKFNFKFLAYYLHGTFCSFFAWPFFLFNPKSVHNARFGAWLIQHITPVLGLEFVLRNQEILSEERGAIIVSNHQSSLDILGGFTNTNSEKDKEMVIHPITNRYERCLAYVNAVESAKPLAPFALIHYYKGLFNIWHVVYKMTVIAKKELFYVWPFGLSAYLSGIIFIDRSNTKNAIKQLQITSDIMVKEKTKIWVFPEGTRNKDYTSMLPFKKGAFTMAVDAQVPIIPVVFSPYYFINKEKHIFDKGHIIIQPLEPISTKGLTPEDIPDLIKLVQHKMMATYKELTKEVLEPLPSNYPFTTKG